ncbi:hypothetical protein JOC78_000410 [Bacillus ectoiniformans]|uniref:hypothetical protein n=1 Tax=Bacillus ectoiniformans TaxID=1494429 RepID=UPI001958589B|nr:hypothetical protein [Bacillus ectoiniformans]MBM7647489.1 hypothetical protein [Bacillus ectoiniformans]
MNLNEACKLLEEKFNIKEDTQNIYVYPKNSDGSTNLDAGMKLSSVHDQSWTLYEVQRDQEFELGQFDTKELGILALYVAVKGRFETLTVDQQVKEELREAGDVKSGLAILQHHVSKAYFSLGTEKKEAINVGEEGNKYSVYYVAADAQRIMISKSRPLPGALVVTYNYGRMLEEFDRLIKPWKAKQTISVYEEEQLKRIYMGK